MDKEACLDYAGGTLYSMKPMSHEHHEHEHEPGHEHMDKEAIESFWTKELKDLPERNRRLAAAYQADAAERERRQHRRQTIVTSCMDERTAFTEEALGLHPGEAEVLASGGGRIGIEDFKRIYGETLKKAEAEGKETEICLVTHKCAGDSHKGCAAFANDVEAQTKYFTALKEELGKEFPNAKTDILMLDTTAYGLEPIEVDAKDARLAKVLENGSGLRGFRAKEEAHAGNGIFIGDAYRAWVPDHNSYFRLSALNPDIVGNVGIALNVMEGHSVVDLSQKPIILHVDYPEYADKERTTAARASIDAAVKAVSELPAAAKRLADGSLRLVRSATNMQTWEGKLL